MPDADPRGRQSTRRIAAFLVVAGALQVSPFAVQVLHTRHSMLPGWRMYQKKGHDICDVRITEVLPDGSRASVPLATLGAGGIVRIRRASDADDLVKRQCAAHPGRDLRLTARCGNWYVGWVTERDGAKASCLPVVAP